MKYAELKKKCDVCFDEMDVIDNLLESVMCEAEKAHQEGGCKVFEKVQPLLKKLRGREKGHYAVITYWKGEMDTKMGERLLKADEESEYWEKNCDRYLWMMEVALQSMWRLTYDLGVVCHEWTGSSSKTREIMLSVTSCINELNIRLNKAADKWDEANSCWLELFDTDYSIRKSGNLDMLQWRGHSVDDRKKCAEEAARLHNFSVFYYFIHTESQKESRDDWIGYNKLDRFFKVI